MKRHNQRQVMRGFGLAMVFFLTTLYSNCSGFSSNSSGGSSGSNSQSSTTFQNGAGNSTSTTAANTSSSPSPSDTTGSKAVSANLFLTSLGINIHNDQGYGGSGAAGYVKPLQYLGVRNIRDGNGNLQNLVSLHQQTGVLVSVSSYGNLPGLISAAETLAAAGALLAIEGPNEPNNFSFNYNGQVAGGPGGNWTLVAQFQRDLYAAVKTNSKISQYPVFSPSEVGAESPNVGLQFLTIPAGAGTTMPEGTKYADYVNPHNYVCSNSNEYIDNMPWKAADPTLNAEWDALYVEVGITWGGHYQGYSNTDLMTVPRVTTETGWDSVGNPGGETVQGKVLVNTYLAQFARGWRYTFIYELADGEGGSAPGQGIFRPDYTAKPAADYIHNLTSILADTITLQNPGLLNYSIANQPSTTHTLLLQKNIGVFELVVWSERASGTDKITLNLGSARSSVNIYDVTSGTIPIQVLKNVSSVPLSMTDHAFIVEVTP